METQAKRREKPFLDRQFRAVIRLPSLHTQHCDVRWKQCKWKWKQFGKKPVHEEMTKNDQKTVVGTNPSKGPAPGPMS